ncbi:phosphogluconate dehydratase [Pseudomonadales bacterium]|nr:phosphogluconate dehydratase [Pseudomonadales bacterium]
MNPIVEQVTQRIIERSTKTRAAYLARCEEMRDNGPQRGALGCSNLAHGFAACSSDDKKAMRLENSPNIGIVSSYNDMLSAHQPFAEYPEVIKKAAHQMGCTAQFAGGVPAMCDGVTQGTAGMELSLFSRDVIATATAVSLSHNMFDAVVCLGVCDKIVPGLLIGALSFGHLPLVMVPAGPMASGLSNSEKAKVRQQYAKGEVGDDELLVAESAAYHSAGTCTFYGTANSNQMLMEVMGLHVPGSAFVHPSEDLRTGLVEAATEQACRISDLGKNYTPLCEVVNEKTIVNALVGLMATGGSTNHTIHWVAIARAAGIIINWDDFSELSAVTPLLTRVYPNGSADVNHFHEAGGSEFVIRELIDAGYLHNDVTTIWGQGLKHFTQRPSWENNKVEWNPINKNSLDPAVVATAEKPFQADGGIRLLKGNLGRSVIKVSAVAEDHRFIEAPAMIFNDQLELQTAFEKGLMEKDLVAVMRFQGPQANGMPELHKMTPFLGILQDKGFKVALITDGRMSGASGKVPSAIHITPEAVCGGPIAKLKDGDMVRLDANTGEVCALVGESEWGSRELAIYDPSGSEFGTGRELFGFMRGQVCGAEQGATVFQHWETV